MEKEIKVLKKYTQKYVEGELVPLKGQDSSFKLRDHSIHITNKAIVFINTIKKSLFVESINKNPNHLRFHLMRGNTGVEIEIDINKKNKTIQVYPSVIYKKGATETELIKTLYLDYYLYILLKEYELQ